MSKKRKVLLVFLCVFLLLVVPAGVTIFFLMPKFQVREFIEQEQVEYLMDAFGYISADKTIAESQFADDPVMQTFTEELNYAKARGPLAEWPEVSNAISLAFNQVMTGEAEPADAAADAQATIDGIVGQ